jgi:ribonuclease Z
MHDIVPTIRRYVVRGVQSHNQHALKTAATPNPNTVRHRRHAQEQRQPHSKRSDQAQESYTRALQKVRSSRARDLARTLYYAHSSTPRYFARRNPLTCDRIFASPPLISQIEYPHSLTRTNLLLLEPCFISQHNPYRFNHLHKGLTPAQREAEIEAKPPVRMHCYITFLTTPTADTPGTTLLLHFDNKRYLIGNMSEGTQRACVQRSISLAKVRGLFLTGKMEWRTTGGLLGMILTLADVVGTQNADRIANASGGAKRKNGEGNRGEEPRVKRNREGDEIQEEKVKLGIHGGRNIMQLLGTARRFVFRKGLPVDVYEARNRPSVGHGSEEIEPTWTDDNIQVWAMSILPSTGLSHRPCSPLKRKRSTDDSEMSSPNGGRATNGLPLESDITGYMETEEEMLDRHDQIRRGVVGHMFDSNWRLDSLVTSKLSEVRMPAQIFTRVNGKIERYTGLLPGGSEAVPDIDVLVRMPWPGASIEKLPPTTPSKESLCWIVKSWPQRGRFDAVKAKELGVIPGPDFKKLTDGQSVTTADGTVVTPEMVLAPGRTGGGVAVVELPDVSYIETLVNRPEWTNQGVMDGIGAIVWILSPGVATDERLAAFRDKFVHLQHIISSVDTCPNMLALESPGAAAIRLNLLDADRFPVPFYNNAVPSGLEGLPANRTWRKAKTGMTIQLQPSFEVHERNTIKWLDTDVVVKNMDQKALRLAESALATLASPEYQSNLEKSQADIPHQDAEIITLGTGSALPSKYRNVSATLLRVPGRGAYLFDCGENTLGQMKRVFGPEEMAQILRELRGIWISHLHADHHLGTVSVIRAWSEAATSGEASSSSRVEKRLFVASDDGMLQFLREYSQIEDYGFDKLELIDLNRQNGHARHFSAAEEQEFGLAAIRACPVKHCYGALAVVFDFPLSFSSTSPEPQPFRVAYSGDCLPSADFARLGRGATVLIHEATFDDELKGDAAAKKHSTTSDALWVAKEMGARRVLLTHFSQRYQKIPVMQENGVHGGEGEEKKDVGVIVAFDGMRVKVGDMKKVELFREALGKLYEKEEK